MGKNAYDGILRRHFLSEHWHKGIASAMAAWLPAYLLALSLFTESSTVAMVFASAIGVLIILAVFTHYEGFTLELAPRRYRRYTWVLGLRFGRWYPLPVIVRIQVRSLQRRHLLPVEHVPGQLGLTATERGWQVLLSVSGSSIGIVAAYTKLAKAQTIAHELAHLLMLPVVLSTDEILQ
ncbi:hypothetical protein [Hymenobacter koreensis]|uniref:PH domain-containing protein n=1 Tax=Hymenobacter koreensis TaxID=1084523 RepID=A0ABP8J401_9BACT